MEYYYTNRSNLMTVKSLPPPQKKIDIPPQKSSGVTEAKTSEKSQIATVTPHQGAEVKEKEKMFIILTTLIIL